MSVRQTPPGPNGKFDLEEYLGTWYQVGRLPTPFQQNCARSIATYGNLPPQNGQPRISVVNQCLDSNGQVVETIQGTGLVVNDNIPPELIVSFPGIPQTGQVNYVVRETNYDTYAIVGTYDNKSLFLLTRDAIPDPKLVSYLVRRSGELGYPTDQIVFDEGVNVPVKRRHHHNYDCDDDDCDSSSSNWWIIIIVVVVIIIILAVAMGYHQSQQKYVQASSIQVSSV